MNKTVNINLAGIFFHIDENAYSKLQRYLEAIKRSFTDSQGRSEILLDIEARIAELFNERIKNEKQVISIKEVEEVITIMGQPEDYIVDEEIFEDEPQPRQSSQSTRKLFRDTDNAYIGGVSSGLGHYFDVDPLWIRLAWVLLFVFGGAGFLIYILLWILMPTAKTTAEKLSMSGKPVNITNIEQKVKEGFSSVKESLDEVADKVKQKDFSKVGDKVQSTSKSFFDALGNIIMFFFKVFAKFIGIILIITGISTLITLVIAFFTVGIADVINIPGVDMVGFFNSSGVPIWLISLLLIFAIGIPFFFLFYLGLKILINNLKSIGNIAKYTLTGLWIFSIIALSIIGVREGLSYQDKASFIKTDTIESLSSNDTIVLRMVQNDFYSNSFRRSYRFEKIYNKNGEKILMSQSVRLIVRSTTDSVVKIKVEKIARGIEYNKAKQRAENIIYNYKVEDNNIMLDNYFTIDRKDKIKNQHVKVTVYLPESSVLYADSNTYNYHSNDSRYFDILDHGMEEHFLKIIKNDVICLDCPKDENYKIDINIKDADSEFKLDEDGLQIKNADVNIKVNREGVSGEDEDIQVKIDSNGIEIKSKDN
ncbi:MAG: PspC domain-containing protein [Flavobacteriaceae bacterium]|nr:PspC domain-containing protein [Flavobacteriaceae bacterium]